MQKLFIFAAIVAICVAAPSNVENVKQDTVGLQRPSPINPNVPSDAKPARKLGSLPAPIAQQREKRDSSSPQHKPAPTSVPAEKPLAAPPKQTKELTPAPTKTSAPVAPPQQNHRQKREDTTSQHPEHIPLNLANYKRDIPVSLTPKEPHPEESPKLADQLPNNAGKKDEVQVEDLNQHVPNVHPYQQLSTTDQSIIRHQPVPVAELFGRPKSQSDEKKL